MTRIFVRYRLRLWIPVLGWAGLIFYLSSISDLSTGLGSWDWLMRKTAHVVVYAILAGLLWRALSHDTNLLDKAVGWVTLGLVSAYAISDEIHQIFVPGRTGSVLDGCIDVLGGMLALYVLHNSRAISRLMGRRPRTSAPGSDAGSEPGDS